MNVNEEKDVLFLRASTHLLSQFKTLLPKVLYRRSDRNTRRTHSTAKEKQIAKLIICLEPFQEDPQLLDTHLKEILRPLVEAFLEDLCNSVSFQPSSGVTSLSNGLCQILYTLCKIRGEKVIVGFLNNEPRFLEPILMRLVRHRPQARSESIQSHRGLSWDENYVLLLWLSHLMLTPFDLASISSPQNDDTPSQLHLEIQLPDHLPSIASRIIPLCLDFLDAPTKERNAAAALLVRLSLRPDMREFGLLDSMIRWALIFFANVSEMPSEIHHSLGVLAYLSRLVASATDGEIGPHVSAIFVACKHILDSTSLKSSAVARKLIIKTLRNIVVHCIKTHPTLDSTAAMLEDVIDFLLESLSDRDTPVRYATSKALSIIAMALEQAMSEEVVEAILGFLNEDIVLKGSAKSLSSVNPLRWHGLILTLSHLLYRKTVKTAQLPDVLNALVIGLSFKQRTPTGGSIGINVRDAACFGIWALSRRYSTPELLTVQTNSIPAAAGYDNSHSIPQVLAIELLVTACLDPTGNIRRGSSAALQELIGRHPDTIYAGIQLTQVVDYNAVGLRERALSDVSVKAGKLQKLYWKALFQELLGWRGVGSLDSESRIASATAIAKLSENQPMQVVGDMLNQIVIRLNQCTSTDVEERHGLILSQASLIKICVLNSKEESTGIQERSIQDLEDLLLQWSTLGSCINLTEESFMNSSLRPELTSSAYIYLLGSLSGLNQRLKSNVIKQQQIMHVPELALSWLDFCLTRTEDAVLLSLPEAVRGLCSILPSPRRHDIVRSWLDQVKHSSSRISGSALGYPIALGASYATLEDEMEIKQRILDILTSRCTLEGPIESRVNAITSLSLTFETVSTDVAMSQQSISRITEAIHASLNDYTINERGDIGSLVRLEAISAVAKSSHLGIFHTEMNETVVEADITRLSLEKLDKVRTEAASCLSRLTHPDTIQYYDVLQASSYEYFLNTLVDALQPECLPWKRFAIFQGYISSAGLGSESVIQMSRSALVDVLTKLAINDENNVDLVDVCNVLLEIFRVNLSTDRTILPLLEVYAFLFDAHVMQRLIGTDFKWRTLLSLVQKAHFKSTIIPKLIGAIAVYRGLAEIPVVQIDVKVKLCNMLLHPFPMVRNAASETLLILTGNVELKSKDWSRSPKTLREFVETIKQKI